jgi:ribonuclease HI
MSLKIYTDGSAIGNVNVTKDTPAGWGFVVVYGGDSHDSGENITEKFGRVVTDRNHPLFYGAEVGSNNTGELTAIYEALEWCLEKKPSEVTVYSDSQYALNVVFGSWTASKNKLLVSNCKALATKVSVQTKVNYEHIKAHAGHKWNERADELAYEAATGKPNGR